MIWLRMYNCYDYECMSIFILFSLFFPFLDFFSVTSLLPFYIIILLRLVSPFVIFLPNSWWRLKKNLYVFFSSPCIFSCKLNDLLLLTHLDPTWSLFLKIHGRLTFDIKTTFWAFIWKKILFSPKNVKKVNAHLKCAWARMGTCLQNKGFLCSLVLK